MYQQALEEEIEGLKEELVNAELANDELNLELQELQEQELARCESSPRFGTRSRSSMILISGRGCCQRVTWHVFFFCLYFESRTGL